MPGEALVSNLANFVLVLIIGACVIANALSSALEEAERRHHRGEKAAAYRLRRAWKKSDVTNLKTLNLNATAQKRIELLSGKGRPVVKAHRPLDQVISEGVQAFLPLVSPDASPSDRKRAFKKWPYWKHHVEALFRGEHELAKMRGIAGPASHAERLVGSALGISVASVHAICGEIRVKRKEWEGAADFPPMTLEVYEQWMKTGDYPDG